MEDAGITLLYLPPNATSKIQPCDAEIIRNFKAYCRRRFNRQLLDRLENNQPDAAKINVLEKFSWRMQHGLCMCSLSASATALGTANSAPPTWTTLQTQSSRLSGCSRRLKRSSQG